MFTKITSTTNNIIQYELGFASNYPTGLFTLTVSNLINEDLQPYGQPFVLTSEEDGVDYVRQAMVKYGEPDDGVDSEK